MSTEVYPPGIPNIDLHQRWHAGERKMQALAKTPETVLNASRFFRPFLTLQHQEFVSGLEYMFLGTLDEHGRPWVSMLSGRVGFMRSSDPKVLEIQTRAAIVPPFSLSSSSSSSLTSPSLVQDPILHNILHGERFAHKEGGIHNRGGLKTYWSGVALDFSNRRRNKMNGVLYPDNIVKLDTNTGDLHVRLTVEQTIGNCPKYITIREIVPRPNRSDDHIQQQQQQQQRQHESTLQEYQHNVADLGSSAPQVLSTPRGGTTILSEYEQEIIRQADCVFLATRYIDEALPAQTNGMDCNHRGGNPGFVRIKDNTILIPDYSGNRFYQSLGNIVNDSRIGLLFIGMTTGDTLHITGRARVLLNEEAQKLYPRVQRLVLVEMDDALLQKEALPFTFKTKELSPYNPRIPRHQHPSDRHQNSDAQGQAEENGRGVMNKARLTRIERLSRDVASFHFTTTQPIQHLPGQYAVMDFSAFNTVGYQHMNNANPKSVNDDYIRTWTISSAPKVKKIYEMDKNNDDHNNNSRGSNKSNNNNNNNRAIEWESQNEFTVTVKRKPDGAISTLLHRLTEYLVEDKIGKLEQPGERAGGGTSRRYPLLEIPFIAADGEFVLPLPTDSVFLGSVSSPREEQETSETPETYDKQSSAAAPATSQPRFGSTPASLSLAVPVPVVVVASAASAAAPGTVAKDNSPDLAASAADTPDASLSLSPFSDSSPSRHQSDSSPLPIRLVFLAGGIGVTPFLSMISGIQEILMARAASGKHPTNDDGFNYEVDLLVSGSTYEDTLPSVLESLLGRMTLIPESWRNRLKLRISALVSDPGTIPSNVSRAGSGSGSKVGLDSSSLFSSSPSSLPQLSAAIATTPTSGAGVQSSRTTSTSSTTTTEATVTVVGGRLSKTRLVELVPDLADWRAFAPTFGSSVSVSASASSPQKQQQQSKQHRRYQQTKVLLCGPASYMEAARNFLQEIHVPVGYIHMEEFNF
ncbi:hypothetical protein BGW41_003444 [Actinomortierella wolfii]|nr:hypothetical protein BGW41_003444 [Actinomortierella wolfii]